MESLPAIVLQSNFTMNFYLKSYIFTWRWPLTYFTIYLHCHKMIQIWKYSIWIHVYINGNPFRFITDYMVVVTKRSINLLNYKGVNQLTYHLPINLPHIRSKPKNLILPYYNLREAGRYGIADSNYYSELVLKGLITVTPACLPYTLYISYCIVH